MLSSTEERLKQILRRMQQETDANARAHESAAEADRVKKDLKQLQDRWAYDTTLIEAAIKTLQEKLQGIQFRFLAGPRNPGTVATAELAGKVGNNASGKITFNVFETGIVRIYFDRKAPSEFLLMTSNQEKYESVLLDFVERLIDCPQSN